jgi:hypothetical protein
MTHKTLTKRLERIEARRRPAARVVVCWCSLADGQHLPDCPAAGAPGPVVTIGGAARDVVVLAVHYEEAPITNPNPAPSVTPQPPPAPAAAVPAFVVAAQERVRKAYTRR